MPTKVAVIQRPPVMLDRDNTIARAAESIGEAAAAGATLLVFPEAYIPGYPAWIGRLRPGGDMALSSDLHARPLRNAVDLQRGDLQQLQDQASKHSVTIVIGMNEIDSGSRARRCSTPWSSSVPMAAYSTAIATWSRPIPNQTCPAIGHLIRKPGDAMFRECGLARSSRTGCCRIRTPPNTNAILHR